MHSRNLERARPVAVGHGACCFQTANAGADLSKVGVQISRITFGSAGNKVVRETGVLVANSTQDLAGPAESWRSPRCGDTCLWNG